MTPEVNKPDIKPANREEYIKNLTHKLAETDISGPGAAAWLYEAHLTLQEAQQVLNTIGYQAYANMGDNRISVSVERFEKGTLSPAHYPSRIVSFNPEDERPNWLSEIE